MDWAKPQYRRAEVNKAGKFLLNNIVNIITSIISKDEEFDRQFSHHVDVIDNFRAVHAFPLNTLQNNLRAHSSVVDTEAVVAQRLKRFTSILWKLSLFPTMELWDMQDIGGCRSIVKDVDKVRQLVNIYKTPSSRIRHKLVHEDDYITHPRSSGYRSYHLIYRYMSDRNDIYNGLKIEMQIRTLMQHAWATTVETVDAFTEQALKSSRGHRDWERFFQLMGTEMALREGTSPVSGTPVDRAELIRELRDCADKLNVKRTLTAFTDALHVTEATMDAKYFLLSLDASAEQLNINGYKTKELDKASQKYTEIERQIRQKGSGDAVLVSVDSIQNLRRAYPNYFADTRMFIDILDESLKTE